MKYAYENLGDEQFETLVVCLCQCLFGISVQGFAKGPDGGRDAKFVGTATLFPSEVKPWAGTTIIQAKHTNGYNRLFSETDFFNPDGKNSVIAKEIPRIKNLRSKQELDHYLLCSNRRLGGNAESDIRRHIATECAIPIESIHLCDVEQLELWLRKFPEAARQANLDPIDSPLIVSSEDLAEVVQALARQKAGLVQVIDAPPTARVTYEKKNQVNKMTVQFAAEMRKRYLKDTAQIRSFLASPGNSSLLQMYESVVAEFQLKIIAKRKDYQTFDEVMVYLIDLLFNRDAILRQRNHKRLTQAVLFYMYWNCDIGETGDA